MQEKMVPIRGARFKAKPKRVFPFKSVPFAKRFCRKLLCSSYFINCSKLQAV